MKYKVSVTKTFSAAHALRGYKGRCENLHGHNWKVKTSLCGTKLDKIGMIMDFTDIKAHLDSILGALDHKYLNETAPFNEINPTAENIAAYIYNELKRIIGNELDIEIEVWESETSSALVSE